MARNVDKWTPFITDLQRLERSAYDLGLPETARAINIASQRAGWEMAAKKQAAMKAAEKKD